MDFKPSDYDRCPACRKKVKNMLLDGGKVLILPNFQIVCSKCGNVFILKSLLVDLAKQASSPIVRPNAPEVGMLQRGGKV